VALARARALSAPPSSPSKAEAELASLLRRRNALSTWAGAGGAGGGDDALNALPALRRAVLGAAADAPAGDPLDARLAAIGRAAAETRAAAVAAAGGGGGGAYRASRGLGIGTARYSLNDLHGRVAVVSQRCGALAEARRAAEAAAEAATRTLSLVAAEFAKLREGVRLNTRVLGEELKRRRRTAAALERDVAVMRGERRAAPSDDDGGGAKWKAALESRLRATEEASWATLLSGARAEADASVRAAVAAARADAGDRVDGLLGATDALWSAKIDAVLAAAVAREAAEALALGATSAASAARDALRGDRGEREAAEAIRSEAASAIAAENDAELAAARAAYRATWVRAGRDHADARSFLATLRDDSPFDDGTRAAFERAAAKLRVQARAKSLVQALYALERKNRLVKDALRAPALLGRPPHLQPLLDNGVPLDAGLVARFGDALATRDGEAMADAARSVLDALAEIATDYRDHEALTVSAITAAAEAYARTYNEPLVVDGCALSTLRTPGASPSGHHHHHHRASSSAPRRSVTING